MGTPEYPLNGTATIKLYGNMNDESVVYSNAIEAGNKLIANTGYISMYATPR
jgi:hypothetical protein